MSTRHTSKRPRVFPWKKATRTRRRASASWAILAFSLGVLGTIAVTQIDPGPWRRTAIEPDAIGVELPDTELRGAARVIDGDTLDINGSRIRLHGIDAPESRQTCLDARGISYDCGARATQALTRRIGAQIVTCSGHEQDRYGRIIATCSVNGADLGAFMVGAGHALAYQRYSTAYVGAQNRAQSSGIGIWQGAFTAPWDWRRGMR